LNASTAARTAAILRAAALRRRFSTYFSRFISFPSLKIKSLFRGFERIGGIGAGQAPDSKTHGTGLALKSPLIASPDPLKAYIGSLFN
jgi:hypothetical protein